MSFTIDKADYLHDKKVCEYYFSSGDEILNRCYGRLESFSINDIDSGEKSRIKVCLQQKFNVTNIDLFYVGQNEEEIDKVRSKGYVLIHSTCTRPIEVYNYDYEGKICLGPITDCYIRKDFPVNLIICAKTGAEISGVQNSNSIEEFANNCRSINWD